MLNIDSEPMAKPITNSRRLKKRKSTSGVSTRASTSRRRMNATAANTNGPRAGRGADHAPDNAFSPNTNATMNVAIRRKPSQSSWGRFLMPAWGVAEPGKAMPTLATIISRALSQKIARQPAMWVRAPPSSGPMLKPSIRNPVQAPIAAALRSGAALAFTAARVQGTAKAAAKPCKVRPASSAAWLSAMAMIQDATPNSANPTRDDRRTPNRSAARPPSTMQAADVTR